ncbi:arsenic resistance protein [Desulfofundulus salinus]|uniref:Arsenic resistance protein n=1 Tax=Desulfofundulus salinus TaxID=2419843 RepID=A0A494WX31_9FIRM|nr:bile acid:sodium symporter [Desulfofundulus salinum]RKO67533.1 arsenic resistance protein [Desulfofundulus salinum]
MSPAEFINKYFIIVLIFVICSGLFLGYFYPEYGHFLEALYPVSLFVMLFPMMITIKVNEMVMVSKRIGFITVVMFFNYLVSPLLAAFLGHIFLSGYPDFAVGLIISNVVPCGGMIVAWTAMSRGNAPMTLVITVVSLLAGIVLIPFWIWALAGKYVPVDGWKILQTIFFTIAVPLLLGNFTRVWLTKKFGREKFDCLKPAFTATSLLGLFMIFFIAMMSQSRLILKNLQYIAIVGLPLIAFYILLLAITLLYARFTRTTYQDMVSLVYGVNGKNMSIALAIAVVSFSPLTVLFLAVKSVIQFFILTAFYKITPYLREYWLKVLPVPAVEADKSVGKTA